MMLNADAVAGDVPIAEECFTGAAAGRIFISTMSEQQAKEAGLSSRPVNVVIRVRTINR